MIKRKTRSEISQNTQQLGARENGRAKGGVKVLFNVLKFAPQYS